MRVRGVATAGFLLTSAVALVNVLASTPAHATNPGTVSGDKSTGCSVNWTAQTNYNDPNPALQSPTGPTNAGYVSEVTPSLGGPGLLEVQHFQLSNNVIAWRIPLAESREILNGTLSLRIDTTKGTLSAPQISPFNYPKAAAAAGNPLLINTFANTYQLAADPSRMGTLPADAYSTDSYQWLETLNQPFDPNTVYTAVATLTGTYVEGAGCPVTTPAPPSAGITGCTRTLAGQTVFPLGAADITARNKYGTGGEINADGWGMPTPTFRLYAATTVPLSNVTVRFSAAQGFTFSSAPGPVVTASTTGMGQLYANGYTVAATGIGTPQLSADRKMITLTVSTMPPHSAIAFNAPAAPDGSGQALVMNATMTGTQTGCPAISVPSTHLPVSTDLPVSTQPPAIRPTIRLAATGPNSAVALPVAALLILAGACACALSRLRRA